MVSYCITWGLCAPPQNPYFILQIAVTVRWLKMWSLLGQFWHQANNRNDVGCQAPHHYYLPAHLNRTPHPQLQVTRLLCRSIYVGYVV